MNDKQKIEDLFHNEARVVAVVAKATRYLSINRGRTATYAESMEEFGYAFRGLVLGIDLPDFHISHPEIEVDIAADRKAKKYVFGKPANRDRFARFALEALRQLNRHADFEQAITIYPNYFDQFASLYTAEEVMGINVHFELVRSNCVMTAAVLQELMPSAAKYPGFDKQVYHLFKMLDAGRPDAAYAIFDRIRDQHNRRLSFVSERSMKDYLIQLTRGLESTEGFASQIADLEHWGEKYKVKEKLERNLEPKGLKVVVKI